MMEDGIVEERKTGTLEEWNDGKRDEGKIEIMGENWDGRGDRR